MTTFVYRRVDDGQEVHLPELQLEIECAFPNHQRKINKILCEFKMDDWRITFTPGKSGGGLILSPLRIIVIVTGTMVDMLVTLYHEISHYLHQDLNEATIEEMGWWWYLLREGE